MSNYYLSICNCANYVVCPKQLCATTMHMHAVRANTHTHTQATHTHAQHSQTCSACTLAAPAYTHSICWLHKQIPQNATAAAKSTFK